MVFKRLSIIMLSLLLLGSLGAFADEQGEPAPAAPAEGVFATINGETVSQADFYGRLEDFPVSSQFGSVTAGVKTAEEVLNELLITQYAKKENLLATDEQVQQKLDMIAKQTGGDIGMVLEQSGMNLEQFRQKIGVQQSLINIMTKGVEVTDAEVRNAYDDALKEPRSPFKTPNVADLSMITCAELTKIKKAYEQLQKGVDFGKVAAEYSERENAENDEGHLGWVPEGSPLLPKEIFKAAWNLATGRYTVTIKAEDRQWYIVKVNEKNPGQVTPFEQVKNDLKEQLAVDKASRNPAVFSGLQTFIRDSSIVLGGKYQGVADRIKRQAAAEIGNISEDAGNTE